MKSHKLLPLITFLAVLPWQLAGAQTTAQTTLVARVDGQMVAQLVAQAAPPNVPMPTADEKTAPANAIGKPVPGSEADKGKNMPSTEETSPPKAGSSPRQPDPGADTRQPPAQRKPGDTRPAPQGDKAPMPEGKSGSPGGKTGAPDNAGMPGSGASSGSGGGADTR